MFFDGFCSKTNHLLRANMSYCYEKIITISPKLATLASGQILTHFLMIHRYTHTHTDRHKHRRKRYQYTWKISSCHVITAAPADSHGGDHTAQFVAASQGGGGQLPVHFCLLQLWGTRYCIALFVSSRNE